MRSGDQEVEIGSPGERDDGSELLLPVPFHYGRIGELLLEADELEETLETARRRPEVLSTRCGETPESVLHRVERLLDRDHVKITVLEEMGALHYGRIEQAMRAPRSLSGTLYSDPDGGSSLGGARRSPFR